MGDITISKKCVMTKKSGTKVQLNAQECAYWKKKIKTTTKNAASSTGQTYKATSKNIDKHGKKDATLSASHITRLRQQHKKQLDMGPQSASKWLKSQPKIAQEALSKYGI